MEEEEYRARKEKCQRQQTFIKQYISHVNDRERHYEDLEREQAKGQWLSQPKERWPIQNGQNQHRHKQTLRKYAKTRKVDRTLLPPLPDTKEAREAEERLYLDQEKVLKQAGTLLRYGIVLLSPLPRVQYPGPEQIGDGYNVDVHIFLVHPWDVQIRQVGNEPENIINMHDVAPIEHCVGPVGFLKESTLTMIKNEIIRAACKAFWAPSLVRTDHFEGRWRWGYALTARSEAGEYAVREDNIDIIGSR
ncbi:hypothetical protein LTR37_013092 [Vermiconidia calcicola]|uniref:Uncharacterized protein n=1 Tax=Vermiconidia calcicola TaxID=1690605 RepID=A0ACC3MYY2_9PEZI|nr:hypothetical protein LTR37_013092 [Vermiconidia calcicola]